VVGRRGDVNLDARHRPRVDEEPADVRRHRTAILQHLSLATGVSSATPSYECTDGSTATLAARPTVLDSDGAPDWSRDPVVVSLARWDLIKDPLGVLDGFLERVLPASDAHLLLAGPDPSQVADDPAAAAVLAGVRERWRRLPPAARERVHLACLPLTSLDENAAMVNAIQRLAVVVVTKSLQEGFGLGVTEAMWKARPVVASAVGGISSRSNICTVGCWSRTLLTCQRSAMRSSGSCENLLSQLDSAKPRANESVPSFSTTGISCAGSRSWARR
jgi:glycosyltransferase involved in cell wall biosynthesis